MEYADEDIIEALSEAPEGLYHENLVTFAEHGQQWAECTVCGAQWSVVETSDGPGFEEVSHGDEYCRDSRGNQS